MSDYSYKDLMRMQDEAKQRVIEMQKRSKYVADSFRGAIAQQDKPEVKAEEKRREEELPRKPKAISYPADLRGATGVRASSGQAARRKGLPDIRNTLMSFFSDMSSDDCERMFILSLCLLLSKEKADDSLIIALMYLAT